MAATLKPDRRRVLMLVPHEPSIDPRVHYTATSLAKRYQVTVIATVRESQKRPEENYAQNPTYSVIRIPLQYKGVLRVGLDFYETMIKARWGFAHGSATKAAGLVMGVMTVILVASLGTALLALEFLVLVLAGLLLPFIVAAKRLLPTLIVTPTLINWVVIKGGDKLQPSIDKLRAIAQAVQATRSTFQFMFAVNATLLRYIVRQRLLAEYIYCHDLYCLQTATTLKEQNRFKLIYDSHEYYPYLHQHPIFRRLTRFYECVLVSFVDTYITVSPQLAQALEQEYGRSNIIAIPNVEPRPVNDRPLFDSDVLGFAKERLKLLYQGTFAEGRGLDEVLRAWSNVDGSRAVLFLRGPRNEWRDRLEAQAKDMGFLGRSVYFLGPVLERDLIAAARDADLGLIPYKGESEAYRFACPNKLSQYLHAGLAIISTTIPFVRKMIEEGDFGICYEDTKSFAEIVNRLAKDQQAVKRLRFNAQVTSRERFCWENYEEQLFESVETGGSTTLASFNEGE